MGRPRQYDRDEVLRRARDAFWAKGYTATSIEDLLEAMDLNRGSLYAGFHGKRELFIEALRNYRSEVLAPAVQALLASDQPMAALRGHFETFVDHTLSHPALPGCMITNTVAELAHRDAPLRLELAQALEEYRDAFAEVLRRAQSRGELPGNLAVAPAAMQLVGLALGLNVLGKAIPNRDTMMAMVDVALAGLRGAGVGLAN
jgi:TetR/AcrR family transcriptional repressor of nem operon